MRLAVIIPTTDGPTRIERITRLTRAPLSQVITSDDFVPNTEMASRYHALVDQSGPLRELIALSDVRFELCFDRVPEMGRSWELAVVLAHWVLDQGHELVTSEAELVVWATGVVKPGREIAEEDYHLESKLSTSQPLLDTLGEHARLVVLLPGNTRKAQVANFRSELDPATVVKVANIDAAVAVLQQSISETTPVAEHSEVSPGSKQPVHKKWRAASGIIFALLIAVAGFALVQLLSQEGPILSLVGAATDDLPVQSSTPAIAIPKEDAESATEPAAPQTVKPIEPAIPAPDTMWSLLLVEHRAPPGASCTDVLFGSATATRIKEHPVSNEFPGSSLVELCALSFEWDGEPTDALLYLPSEFLARVISSDRASSVNLGGSSLHLFHIVDGAVPLKYEVIFVRTGDEQMILKHTLMEP